MFGCLDSGFCFKFHVCQLPLNCNGPRITQTRAAAESPPRRFGDRRFVRCNYNVKFHCSSLKHLDQHYTMHQMIGHKLFCPHISSRGCLLRGFSTVSLHHFMDIGLYNQPLFINGLDINIILKALFCVMYLKYKFC